MTFKHVKFEDSVTMRSLERLAKEKGLVESPIPKKEASAPDYRISSNLMQNILKLCSGLRALGQNKFANELEEKFIVFKKANKLYETSSEKGEDLVDEAHPKGSHKLEGIEGDAVIETIIDQHLKMLDVIKKKPTGKLASSKNILGAVKTVLAQDNIIANNLSILKDSLVTVKHIYDNQNILTRPITDGGVFELTKFVAMLSPENINRAQAFKVKADLEKLYNSFEPYFFGGVNIASWNSMKPYLDSSISAINAIIKEVQKGKPEAKKVSPNMSTPKDEGPVADFNAQLRNSLNLLSLWETTIQSDPENNENDKKNAMAWIKKKREAIEFIKSQFDQLDPSFKADSVGLLSNNLNKVKSEFEQFKKVWIG